MNSHENSQALIVFDKLRNWYSFVSLPMAEQLHEDTKDPYQVLIGVLLSARTKDTITHKVTKRLFQKYPTIHAMSRLSIEELTKLLYPVGFYKIKAKHVFKLNKILLERFNGEVPRTRSELMELPGVGRKTANLVLSVAFNQDEICVDTHVHRLSNFFGWVNSKTPVETECQLRRIFPKTYYRLINPVLVRFGQEICRPRAPLCEKCIIKQYCPKYSVKDD